MQDFLNSILSSLDAAKFIGTQPIIAFAMSYAAGVLTAFTPCVWPVYPLSFLTISKIVAKNGSNSSKLANLLYLLVFVAGIAIAFAIVGLLIGILGMSFQIFVRTGIPMIIVGLIFILLSLSMFGFYEIRIPYFITKRIPNNFLATKNLSFFSIFLMGAFSGFITSPCVAAPLAGILTLIAVSGEILVGFFMLLAFGFGIGTPFLVIGIAGTSKIVPPAGRWMKIVQYLIGVVLFVLGLFFIYDQVRLHIPKNVSTTEKNVAVVCDSVAGICYFDPKTDSYIKKNNENIPSWKNVNSIEQLEKYYDAKKPFMLRFTAHWCKHCQLMDKESFSSAEFAVLASDIKWLVTDVANANRETERLMAKYFVSGVPAILMFNGERDTIMFGYLSQKDLFERMTNFYFGMGKKDNKFILNKNLFKPDTANTETEN